MDLSFVFGFLLALAVGSLLWVVWACIQTYVDDQKEDGRLSGHSVGWGEGIRKMEREAIDEGYGRYAPDDGSFEWIDKHEIVRKYGSLLQPEKARPATEGDLPESPPVGKTGE